MLPRLNWGTGIRTPIDGSKDRSPAIRRSPIGRLKIKQDYAFAISLTLPTDF